MALNDCEPNKGITKLVSLTEALIADLRAMKAPPAVLIVEDDPNDRELMRRTLEHVGCLVLEAKSGKEAMEMIGRSLTPAHTDLAIVFLDLNLPGGPDGLAILREIRRLAPALPVVIVTGFAETAIMADAALLGYFGIVNKPLERRCVEEILAQHRINPVKVQNHEQ